MIIQSIYMLERACYSFLLPRRKYRIILALCVSCRPLSNHQDTLHHPPTPPVVANNSSDRASRARHTNRLRPNVFPWTKGRVTAMLLTSVRDSVMDEWKDIQREKCNYSWWKITLISKKNGRGRWWSPRISISKVIWFRRISLVL